MSEKREGIKSNRVEDFARLKEIVKDFLIKINYEVISIICPLTQQWQMENETIEINISKNFSTRGWKASKSTHIFIGGCFFGEIDNEYTTSRCL
jgi:hypothetical protein